MYLLAKEVISRYCSTGFSQYFAQGCVEVSCYKDNFLFWKSCNISSGFSPPILSSSSWKRSHALKSSYQLFSSFQSSI